ncbi:CBO0543 family protein [Ammoniphilus sp. 3BR4]|uniref:CBO0543 family protein n=1 Tax=Ammoniphilus sp. 3BR4 TaxID=3158265 RepID=UPI0034678CC4
MEKIIIYFFLFISLIILIRWFNFPPFPKWLGLYLLSAFFSIIFAQILVGEYNFFTYPVRLLPDAFNISIVFDFFVFPIFNVFFFIVSEHSTFLKKVITCFIIVLPITISEKWAEVYTDLIEFHRWNILLSYFGSVLFVLGIHYLYLFLVSKNSF